MFKVERYNSTYQNSWNDFIEKANNGTFLFNRNYMDYHSDRFNDFSLLIFQEEELVAVMPANILDNNLFTHQGLTYGGLIIISSLRISKFLSLFYHLMIYLQEQKIKNLYYKCVPSLYHKKVNETEQFVLNIIGATLKKVDTNFILDYSSKFNFQERRHRSIKKAQKAGIEIKYHTNFEPYWNDVLSPHLKEKYNTKPVHSLQEIELLYSRFPEKILQCDAIYNGETIAGATVYIFGNVAHTQYIASSITGRDTGAIDYLFFDMIKEKFNQLKYFSFGTANNTGNDLNFGVAEWKEGWNPEIRGQYYFDIDPNNSAPLKKLLSI